jgi:hypothetical protein
MQEKGFGILISEVRSKLSTEYMGNKRSRIKLRFQKYNLTFVVKCNEISYFKKSKFGDCCVFFMKDASLLK